MSIVKDFARVIFEVERARYPELEKMDKELIEYEELLFVANLLVPRKLLMEELARLDARKNVVADYLLFSGYQNLSVFSTSTDA